MKQDELAQLRSDESEQDRRFVGFVDKEPIYREREVEPNWPSHNCLPAGYDTQGEYRG